MNPEILTPPLLVDSAGNPLLPLKKKPRNGTVVLVDGQRCVSIPVGPNGHQAIVDEADFQLVGGYGWSLLKDPWNNYAFRYETVNKRRVYYKMHRQILGLTDPSIECDHRNHNGLDNRRSNLRAGTTSQNQMNQRHQKNKLGYKGVYRGKSRTSPWIASIRHNNKLHRLGSFADQLEAALAYDKAAQELFGEFACLNFPTSAEPTPK